MGIIMYKYKPCTGQMNQIICTEPKVDHDRDKWRHQKNNLDRTSLITKIGWMGKFLLLLLKLKRSYRSKFWKQPQGGAEERNYTMNTCIINS